jgi:hypothetical protein
MQANKQVGIKTKLISCKFPIAKSTLCKVEKGSDQVDGRLA